MQNTFLYSTSDNDIGFKAGESTHKLTENEMPSHIGHLIRNEGHPESGNYAAMYLSTATLQKFTGNIGRGWNNDGGGEAYPAGVSRGGNLPHNNMPPYTVIKYWRRVF